MLIEYKGNLPERSFGMVHPGEEFKWEDVFFLKLDGDSFYLIEQNKGAAVDLENGQVSFFKNYEMVIPVHLKVTNADE